jgi:hypothetical protein
MQFIKNGPDIPESLLQAHEDGRVVFFCGAGISYPAGLPGFQGLVDQIYSELGAIPTVIEEQAYRKEQYDATLDLLERRIPGQRSTVRAALAKVLQPNLRKKGAKTTHEALLQLARDRSNNVRLVTTNFDRIFLSVMARSKLAIPIYPAPLLPIPKNSRWNGVVYLHGVLPETPDESALNRLVMSSGDFGLAYLTERWAARFVSELFRNYIVCFVGYSINDPVLRYMMDALAADKMLGEFTPQAYAFGSYSAGGENQALVEWEAKGVTPVLYEVPGTHDHSAFHRTLKEWADIHRDGVLGKERIVAQYAVNPPMASTREDNFIGRILWAISHKSGLPAKRFADLDPVPPLAWLEPLTQDLFKHNDLSRFDVPPKTEKDDKLTFSLVRRPAPYTHAPWMALVNSGAMDSQWDNIMTEVANWLLRHLDDPKLVLWIAKRGGQLNEKFARMIGRQINYLDKLTTEGKHNELDRIRASSPAAIPRPIMRTLWRLLLSGRVKSYVYRADLYDWMSRFKQDGLTPTLRLELREILSPRVSLSEPFRLDGDEAHDSKPERVDGLVEWEVFLCTQHPHSALRDWQDKSHWQQALPELLQDFNALLRDTLDLNRELGGADDRSDHSFSGQPSISDHSQNKGFHDWTVLIELARDAWLATVKLSNDRARLAAEGWWYTHYPVFKRLALFAAAQGSVISSERALEWLLTEDAWWLWSDEIRRETMRLLVALAPKLDAAGLSELERAILKGPLREMYKDDLETERWSQIVDRGVWLRLAKIQAAGAMLGSEAQARLENISQKNPQWQLATNESDEFTFWMESSSSIDNDPLRKFLVAPRRRVDLVAWIKQHLSSDFWQDDDWRSRCRDNFSTTSCALFALTREDVWPADRWREALQAWAEDKLLKRSWRYMAPVLANAPDELIQKCAHNISWWLQAIAKTFEGHEELFLPLAQRILALDLEDGAPTDQPVFQAINHPVGQVTEALLSWWYRHSLQDGQGLLDSIKPVFTTMCDTHIAKFRHGRVILAAHAIALFRVDESWATGCLLPLFDWQQSETEARSAWEGFLRSPRLYRPLLIAIKQPMLATSTHYTQLGDYARQYADFLTFAALELGDTFSAQEFAQATSALPPEGLHHAAQALARALEGSGEQRREYWNNRVRPYLKSVWPKSINKISSSIAESLARLCVAADDAFPDALAGLKNWLIPVYYPDYVIRLLHQSNLPQRFPEAALDFMDRIISDSALWPPTDLNECLQAIQKASPNLLKDARYLRLSEYLRRHGRG